MKKHFIWTRDPVVHKTPSDKKRRLNSDEIITIFGRAAEASEHYYSFMVKEKELSKSWKYINKSSIYRMLKQKQEFWEGVGYLFTAIDLYKVLNAPPGSIIIPTFDTIGPPSFEIIKPTDPNYSEAWSRLPGAT